MKTIILTATSLIIGGMTMALEYWDNEVVDMEEPAMSSDCFRGMCLSSYAEKRDQNMPIYTSRTIPVKCPCQPKYHLRKLGAGHYPKTLLTADCPDECSNGSYRCKPVNYTVYVLQHRTNFIREVGEFPLPEPIRSNWQLIPQDVTVTCMSSDIRNKF